MPSVELHISSLLVTIYLTVITQYSLLAFTLQPELTGG